MSARPRPAAPLWRRFVAAALLAAPASALASGGSEAFQHTLLALVVILGGSKLGGDLAVRLKQPAVLGELVGGVLLGNLDLLGFRALSFIEHDPMVDLLAQIGVIVLLFEVGLESTVAQMARVGGTALRVAVLGVVAPMLLGWAVGAWMLPEHSTYVHLFLGATLCATSVGITARVLRDLGESRSREAQVILGAAVIDDVLGLVVLAAVSGIIAAADAGASAELGPIVWIVVKAAAFLFGAVGLGVWITPHLYALAARLHGTGVLLGVSLSFCFALSWAAGEAGLAPIVGAFAAGLVLEGATYRPFTERGEHELEHLLHPVSQFLAPVFFVLMGFRVDLGTFANVEVLGLAAALSVAAVLGKQACALGVWDRTMRRLPIGVGMIPRGEVGLIFANIGLTLTIGGERVIDPGTFAAVVMMVIATTLVTPPALGWALRR